MLEKNITISLASVEATNRLATALAPQLRLGDIVLLSGPIGSGKTHFARALIQTLLRVFEDVPSPSFTLVQTYQGKNFDLWHADLYRLSVPDEVIELGLLDAFDQAVTLIEWPDRLGSLQPVSALSITLCQGDEDQSRLADLSWQDDKWDARIKELANDPA